MVVLENCTVCATDYFLTEFTILGKYGLPQDVASIVVTKVGHEPANAEAEVPSLL